jgi:hypothetical protein
LTSPFTTAKANSVLAGQQIVEFGIILDIMLNIEQKLSLGKSYNNGNCAA